MNSKFKIWLQAARLRTLPLSLSGIIVGNGLAYGSDQFSLVILYLSLATTIAFQVLSNFANDYGDGVKGADNESRIGPARVLQQGLLTREELKRGIQFCAAVSLVFAFALIYVAFGTSDLLYSLIFIILGIASVVAAIKYTVGSNAYGYRALGDLFVFLFFGGVSVLGSYFLQAQEFQIDLILPATALGLLSVGVLNLNNMRDIHTDKEVNKITMAVLLGASLSKAYHAFLLIGAVLTTVFYVKMDIQPAYLFMIAVLPMMIHLRRVLGYTDPKEFDPELKRLALCTFLFAILFAIGQNL
ncbi:MAG: 1,4-dihydroxy-2-naphthoate octaprenyltransferase [Candidatus Arcticimaribacter sp.]|nr:MAG: 1,4-dihydroxy-2-naphthoate octaprenyltransferase [Candidatus Arcticimaribacter sp.]PTM02432.1 MAG: 1,4-dihydroxy-2-naphthoate octaprenyltransferase [Candidatus Arcticimaribacter sp.]